MAFAYGALVSPGISALWGATSLCAAGFVPWDRYAYVLLTWWTGSGVGILILAPALMAWMKNEEKLSLGIREYVFPFILLAASAYSAGFFPLILPLHLPLFAPLLIWSVFNFDRRITFTAIWMAAAIGIIATATGRGPFAGQELNESLMGLQLFASVVAMTLYILSGVIAERRPREEELREKDRLLTAFHQMGKIILSSMNSEQILDDMARQIAATGIFRSLMMAVVDEPNERVEVVRTFYRSPDGSIIRNDGPVVGLRYALNDDNITAEVARNGKMEVIEEWDERFDPRVDKPGSRKGHLSYFIPIKQGDRVLAVLATGSQIEEKEETLHWIEEMQPLFDQFAVAMEHARLYENVQREIAERKQGEEERAKLEARIQQAEKMEAMGNLAGGVAHDLNNILSSVVGFPELILMNLPEDSPLRGTLQIIKNSGEKAAQIVQDLLTLARRGVSVRDVVNANDIISDLLKSPEYDKLKWSYPGVEVETDLKIDLLNILGSPVHLSKTVMNLVLNAFEAMSAGGKLTLSAENRYLDRPIRGYDDIEEGDYVVISVSDTGTGISPEDMERIFEPFYTKKQMGRSGTGLGMTVVWGTVKDHNGYIDVQSTVGEGTTFTLYFPVTRQEASRDQPRLSIKDYMGKGESVLVVDDVEEQQRLAADILTTLGYSVTTVSSGEEAVEYLQNSSVDLLVLDMIMDPGMDGLDTYRRILERHPGQKAIIVSGFSETDRVEKTQRLGAGAYVRKPYLMEKLGMAVRTELDNGH